MAYQLRGSRPPPMNRNGGVRESNYCMKPRKNYLVQATKFYYSDMDILLGKDLTTSVVQIPSECTVYKKGCVVKISTEVKAARCITHNIRQLKRDFLLQNMVGVLNSFSTGVIYIGLQPSDFTAIGTKGSQNDLANFMMGVLKMSEKIITPAAKCGIRCIPIVDDMKRIIKDCWVVEIFMQGNSTEYYNPFNDLSYYYFSGNKLLTKPLKEFCTIVLQSCSHQYSDQIKALAENIEDLELEIKSLKMKSVDENADSSTDFVSSDVNKDVSVQCGVLDDCDKFSCPHCWLADCPVNCY